NSNIISPAIVDSAIDSIQSTPPFEMEEGKIMPAVETEKYAQTAPELKTLRIFIYDLPSTLSGAGMVGGPTLRIGCRTTLYGAETQFTDALYSNNLPPDIEVIRSSETDGDIIADFYFVPVMATCISIMGGR